MSISRLTFSFDSSGWLYVYHLGVAHYLQRHVLPHLEAERVAFSGSSGGALVAAALAGGIDIEQLARISEQLPRLADVQLAARAAVAAARGHQPLDRFEVFHVEDDDAILQAEIVEALLLREADLGLTSQAVEHPGLSSQLLAEGRMHVIAPPGWWQPAELHSPLRLQALAGKALIGIDARDALGSLLRGHIEELDPPPRPP